MRVTAWAATAPLLVACTLIGTAQSAEPSSPSAGHPDPRSLTARTLTVCPRGCNFGSVTAAAEAAQSGDRIIVGPGIYTTGVVLRANGVTLSAMAGAHLKAAAVEGKAAIVVKGDDTVVEGLECSDIAVPAKNGACIRQEGHNLLLRHVHFHDAEEGLLTAPDTGVIVIEDSLFERLGANGYAHGIYVGNTEGVIIRRTSFLASRSQGHEVKSRAARTIIEDSVIASLDGVDSRLIDVPNGGEVVIRNSVLEKGPNSANQELIGFGLEGIRHDRNSLTLDGVDIIVDSPTATLLHGPVGPVFRNVVVVGGERPAGAEQAITWFSSRIEAKLAPYPQLPGRSAAAGAGEGAGR